MLLDEYDRGRLAARAKYAGEDLGNVARGRTQQWYPEGLRSRRTTRGVTQAFDAHALVDAPTPNPNPEPGFVNRGAT